ncbi:hypothetical protein EJ110_NYTH05108 [Nymphaea thermarum]|nr:hypothetical protein EJ110_NYTH05108 [Nymphaea thermarum]
MVFKQIPPRYHPFNLTIPSTMTKTYQFQIIKLCLMIHLLQIHLLYENLVVLVIHHPIFKTMDRSADDDHHALADSLRVKLRSDLCSYRAEVVARPTVMLNPGRAMQANFEENDTIFVTMMVSLSYIAERISPSRRCSPGYSGMLSGSRLGQKGNKNQEGATLPHSLRSKLRATGTLRLMPRMLALMERQRQTAASRSARPLTRLQHCLLPSPMTAFTRPFSTLAQTDNFRVFTGHLPDDGGLGVAGGGDRVAGTGGGGEEVVGGDLYLHDEHADTQLKKRMFRHRNTAASLLDVEAISFL